MPTANNLRRLVLLGTLLTACQNQLEQVARATTATEERDAFAALARHGSVSFTAHDADGKQLDLGAPRWWARARSLRLGADGRTIAHTLIDPNNALVLMQE